MHMPKRELQKSEGRSKSTRRTMEAIRLTSRETSCLLDLLHSFAVKSGHLVRLREVSTIMIIGRMKNAGTEVQEMSRLPYVIFQGLILMGQTTGQSIMS